MREAESDGEHGLCNWVFFFRVSRRKVWVSEATDAEMRRGSGSRRDKSTLLKSNFISFLLTEAPQCHLQAESRNCTRPVEPSCGRDVQGVGKLHVQSVVATHGGDCHGDMKIQSLLFSVCVRGGGDKTHTHKNVTCWQWRHRDELKV